MAAHPDDEVLGMGGTIARLTSEGHVVHVAYMTDGVGARANLELNTTRPDRTIARKRRRDAALAAGELLGITAQMFGDYPDNGMEDGFLLPVTKTIERLIEQYRPGVVYTHHGGDLNLDHQTVHRAVLTATRPLSDCPVREIYTFEVPSSTEWAFGAQPFAPNVFVGIIGQLEQKLASCRCYAEEMRDFPHPRSEQAIRARAQYWGSVCGLPAAEVFGLIRSILP